MIFFYWAIVILVGFISLGKVFGKAFRILGLDEMNLWYRWIVEEDFNGNVWVKVIWLYFAFFSGLLDCSFWYGLKDLFTLHKLPDKVVLDRY